jgi:hypothetical protein
LRRHRPALTRNHARSLFRSLPRLFVFAIAMAFLEAAVVVHLRALYYPDHPLMILPLRLPPASALRIELARELATLVMILCAACLAEKSFVRVFAAFLFVFGLWDIFYYIWLKLVLGWPVSWLEWDVLFLIPWAWFAPWIAPAAVALLFTVWGAWALATAARPRFTLISGILFVAGAALVLAAFLSPGFALLARGVEGFRDYRPDNFSWGVFVPGYLAMLLGLIRTVRDRRQVPPRWF